MKIYLDNTAWLRGPLSSIGLSSFWLSKALHKLHQANSDWSVADIARIPVKKTPFILERGPIHKMDFSKRLMGEKNSIYHSLDTILPPFMKGHRVATLHDCWTLAENNWQESKFQKMKKLKLEKALLRADLIVVSTEHVKSQINQLRPDLKSKIRKVPLGPMLNFGDSQGSNNRDNIDKDAPVAKYLAKDRGYFLCVGNFENRKNHSILFEAMRSLKNIDLVLVGAKGFGWEKTAREFEDLSKAVACFHFEGLSSGAMSALYKNCVAVVQPSLDEGFGLPACEALYFDKPLVLSQIDPFYEIAGEAALYFDPITGVEDLKSYLQEISQNAEFAKNLAMKCESRKHLFAWDFIAKSYLKIYREFS